MARHVIQIPINKSSNSSFKAIIFDDGYNRGYLEPPIVSNKLYSALTMGAIRTGIGFGWDNSLVPTNKKIISARLYLYTIQRHSRAIIYKYGDFSEGSEIPSRQPSDGAVSGGVNAGWDYIDIGELKGNSILIQAELEAITNIYGYRVAEYWELYSHRNSTNKPYLEITYDDIPPEKPSSLYPSGITLNPRDIIRFSWLHNSKEDNQQKASTLQYSINGGNTWTTINQTTANQYYDMPADTLPTSGNVMWRVRTTDGNDEISEYATASFTLGVVPQKAPTPVSPISQYLDENKPIRFEWSFVGGSGNETQSKFDLQYSTNGGNTWTTKTVTTSNNYYELPAGTFSGGNIVWRIRTYNNWDEVSPYSENKSFTVIGSPPIPLIVSITNSGRPNITWQSTGQHIYELQILQNNKVIFDTGSIPSTGDRSFTLEDYLQDGNYKVKLRIYNEYNLYSTWAEKSFAISTVKPTQPILAIYSGEYGVTIRTANTSLKTMVYRDNICIGEVINNTFTDFTGENNKEYKYFIRTVDSNDNFSDSEIKLAKCKFSGNTLALADNPDDFVKLKYGLDSIPRKSNSISNVGNLVYYDGREYPIVEFTEFKSKAKTVSFTLKTKEELNILIELINSKKALLFRDNDRENIYGNIFDLDYSKTILGYYEIGFTITKTGVQYD